MILWLVMEPLPFHVSVLCPPPMFLPIKTILSLALLCIVQHPRREVLDVVWLSPGGLGVVLVAHV